MAMHLRRNLGSYVARRRFPAGFGASLAGIPGGGGGGAAIVPPLSARGFFSKPPSAIKRDLQEIRAEIKDLSRKDFFTLTVGTVLFTGSVVHGLWTLPDDISRIKNFTKSKLGIMSDGGKSSKDGGSSGSNGV